jgi:flagellar motor switch protein FliG
MVSLRKVSGDLVGEVASSLRERLGEVDPTEEASDEADGIRRTATVLQSLTRSEARAVLDDMEQQDAERAAELRDQVYTFDTLLLADDRGIQELLRVVESKNLALALHGEESALRDKFLDNLSERAANMLREEMEYAGEVRPEERDAAQREILEQALKLEQDDKLHFREPQGEGAGA